MPNPYFKYSIKKIADNLLILECLKEAQNGLKRYKLSNLVIINPSPLEIRSNKSRHSRLGTNCKNNEWKISTLFSNFQAMSREIHKPYCYGAGGWSLWGLDLWIVEDFVGYVSGIWAYVVTHQ